MKFLNVICQNSDVNKFKTALKATFDKRQVSKDFSCGACVYNGLTMTDKMKILASYLKRGSTLKMLLAL